MYEVHTSIAIHFRYYIGKLPVFDLGLLDSTLVRREIFNNQSFVCNETDSICEYRAISE